MIRKGTQDLLWSQDGDLRVNGRDIAKTNTQQGRITRQLMLKTLQSRKGDWRFNSENGSDLYRFIGMPNQRETGELIRNSVIQSLTESNAISPSSLIVNVIPIDVNRVSIMIEVKDVFSTESTLLHVDYDLRENTLIPRIIGGTNGN